VNVLAGTPYMNQPHVHDILRRWRTVADSYAEANSGARVFVSEAWVTPVDELARYVRPDELHTTFNFDALMCEWTAESQRNVIDLTMASMSAVGAPPTWVLANHDTTRVVTRYGRPITGIRFNRDGIDSESFAGIGTVPPGDTDVALGRKRARAAVLVELALPGGAYVYQGDELGLEEVEDLPEDVLQDPTWKRSGHTVRGRDGCRVPIPWSGTEPPFGFGSVEHPPWLPQPARWADLTVAAQDANPASMLNLYRAALAERRRNPALGDGTLTWTDDAPDGVLSFTREPGFRCVVNFGRGPYEIPEGAEVLVSSGLSDPRSVGIDESVWLRV
jgi:alpha-glucosidase